MIVAMHLDDRLVHGQVVMAWLPRLQADVVLVANDEVYDNKLRRSTMKLAIPSGVKIAFRKVEEAIDFLLNPENEHYRVMLLVNNPQDAESICKMIPNIKEITIGGIRKNAPIVHDNLNLSNEDILSFKRIMNQGVSVGIKPTPTNKFLDLQDIFNKYEASK